MRQLSEEWFEARLGKVTASNVYRIFDKTKKGEAKKDSHTYMMELIAERLAGASKKAFVSSSMQHGIDNEINAKRCYEFYKDVEVIETGFIEHPTLPYAGASPDGLVGTHGLIEIKCPDTHNHLTFLATKEIEYKYKCQMQWQLACTKRQWCDFVSFDNRVPEDFKMIVTRFERNEEHIEIMEQEVALFLEELEKVIEQIKNNTQAA